MNDVDPRRAGAGGRKGTEPILIVLRQMFEAYNTMWMDGTWEIVGAQDFGDEIHHQR